MITTMITAKGASAEPSALLRNRGNHRSGIDRSEGYARPHRPVLARPGREVEMGPYYIVELTFYS